ncbi:hypothetical protein BKG96_04620, partial [Rodentibacter caecimuris]
RLSLYLQKELDSISEGFSYFSDVEYNRNRGQIKTMIDDEYIEIPIVCDLILHSRGCYEYPNDNLIAVEMKKSNRSPDEKQKDLNRLKILTKSDANKEGFPENVCGYTLGYYLEFNIQKKTYIIKEYQDGQYVKKTDERSIDDILTDEHFKMIRENVL